MTAAVDSRTSMQGILCIFGGMVMLTAQDSIIKWISGSYPLHEIILGRAIVAVLLTVLFAHLEGGLQLLRTRRLPLHLARGLLLVFANIFYFLALAAMPIGEVAAIFFIAPLLITALSVPILGEKVGAKRWVAVVVGLAGVIIMLRPGSGVIELAATLPVLAACCYALTQVLTRRLGNTDRASAMAFYIQLSFLAASGLMGLAVGDGRFSGGGHPSLEFLFRAWSWPSRGDAALIVTCGLLVAIAAYLLSHAYRIAEANVLAPFEYIALPMAVAWGYLLWGDLPDFITFLGIGLIAGSGLFVFYREKQHGRLIATRRPMPRNR